MIHKQFESFISSKIWVYILSLVLFYLVSIFYNTYIISGVNEGDLGRDLYCFYLISKGQLPFINFNWIYGPLVPLLQGINFKLAGASLNSALNLWFIFFLICVYSVFIIVKDFSNRFFGFLAGVLFISYYGFYFHTFNHIVAVPFILLILYSFIKFLSTESNKYIYIIAVSSFVIATIKLNMALAISAPIYLMLYIYFFTTNKPYKHILYSNILVILLTLIVYGFLLTSTPPDQIAKCFPYWDNYIQTIHSSFLEKVISADPSNLTFDPKNYNLFAYIYYFSNLMLWYLLIPLVLIVYSVIMLVKRNDLDVNRIIIIITLSLTALFSAHEYLKTGNTYSMRLWIVPVLVILIFYAINFLIEQYKNKKNFESILIAIFFVLVLCGGFGCYFQTLYLENKFVYVPYQRVKSSLGNIPWVLNFVKCKEYIDNNLNEDDKLFSYPYNMIYNFFAEKDHPTRYLEFYYLSQLNIKDQKKIIKDLEKTKTKFILKSYKKGNIESGIGLFGKTHCQELNKYINDNYELDVTFDIQLNTRYPVVPISFLKRKTPFKDYAKYYTK